MIVRRGKSFMQTAALAKVCFGVRVTAYLLYNRAADVVSSDKGPTNWS